MEFFFAQVVYPVFSGRYGHIRKLFLRFYKIMWQFSKANQVLQGRYHIKNLSGQLSNAYQQIIIVSHQQTTRQSFFQYLCQS